MRAKGAASEFDEVRLVPSSRSFLPNRPFVILLWNLVCRFVPYGYINTSSLNFLVHSYFSTLSTCMIGGAVSRGGH